MSNPRNNGTRTGRLANDPKIWDNKDGSKKVQFTLMVDRNYTNAQGDRQSDAIDMEAFISKTAKGLGPYANIHRGDLISVSDTLRKDVYQKGGHTVYALKVVAEDITFLESRAVTQARLAERVATAEAQNHAIKQEQTLVAVAAAADASAMDELPFG